MNRGNKVSQYFSAETFVQPSVSSVRNKNQQQRGIQRRQHSNDEIGQEFWSKSEISLENARNKYFRSQYYPRSCQPKSVSSALAETYDTEDIETSDITSDSIFRSVSNQQIPPEIPGNLSPSKQKSLEVYRNFSNSDFNHKDLMTLHFVFSNSEYDSARESTNLEVNHLQYFSDTTLEDRNKSNVEQPSFFQLKEKTKENVESPSKPLKRYDLSYLTLNKDAFGRHKSNHCDMDSDLKKPQVCYCVDFENNIEDYRVQPNYKENNNNTQNKILRQILHKERSEKLLKMYGESEETSSTYRTQSEVSSEMSHGNMREHHRISEKYRQHSQENDFPYSKLPTEIERKGHGNFEQCQQHSQENDFSYKKLSTEMKSNQFRDSKIRQSKHDMSQISAGYEFKTFGLDEKKPSNDDFVVKKENTRSTQNYNLNQERYTQHQNYPSFFKSEPIIKTATRNRKDVPGVHSWDHNTKNEYCKGFERKTLCSTFEYQNKRKSVPQSYQIENHNFITEREQDKSERIEKERTFIEEVGKCIIESDISFVSNGQRRPRHSDSKSTNFNTSDYENLSQKVSRCTIHQENAPSVQMKKISYQETGQDFQNNRIFTKETPQCYSQWSNCYGMKSVETLEKSFDKAKGQQISSKNTSRSLVKLSFAPSMHTENEHQANSVEASELFYQSSNIRTENKFLQNAFSLVDPKYNASAFVCNQDTKIGHDENISLPQNEHNVLNMSTHTRESFKQRLSQCESRNINRTKNVIVLFDNKDKFNEVERVKPEKPILKHVSLKQVSIKEYFKKTFYQLWSINLTKADIESELRQLYQRRIHYKYSVQEENTILIPTRLHSKPIIYIIPFVDDKN
ncbi:hypothetical protein WDU94_004450 [Cyamophila willieti]